MQTFKITSSFERLVGSKRNLEDAIDYDQHKWRIGKVTKSSEYPFDIKDLIYFYPLVVKSLKEKIDNEEVAISIPAETFFEDKLKGRELSKKVIEKIKKETGIKAQVLPQGVIALEEIFGNNLLEERKTLVIDGGFNTVNIAIVENEDITYTKTYFGEFGIRDLLERYFVPEIKNKYPESTTNLQKLKEIFLNEKIDAGLKIINIENEKKRAIENFTEVMFNKIIKDIERAMESFEQFTVIGGISYYIPSIETNKPHFIPSGDGEFFTALGMKRYSKLPSIDFGFGDIKVSL